jgi:hypothetical protein
MKTLSFNLFILLLVSAFPRPGISQRTSGESAFEKNIILVDLQTGIGWYKERNFLTTRAPLFLGADYGISEVLSLGVFGGWNQRTYKNPQYPQFDVNFYFYGGRCSIHATRWLNEHTILKFNPAKVDAYFSVWAGRQQTNRIFLSGGSLIKTRSILGAVIGVRMYSMYNVGFLVEIGPGPYGLINLGICGKF